MNQPRITPKELRRRYRQGERDFRGVDLSGASLRGADLRGADLSEADLSRTDLRGVRFDGATLAQTTLSQSKTGARRHWMGLKLLVATGLFSLSSFLANIIYCYIAVFIFNPAGRNSLDTGTTANTIAGILGLVTVVAMVGIVFTRGLLHSLGVALCAVGGAVAVAILFAGVNAFFSIAFVGAGAVAFAVVVAVAGISSIAGVAAGMDTAALALAITGTAVGIGAVAATGAIAVFEAGSTAVALVTGLNIVTISVSILISHRALEGDHRDRLIRDIAVWFGSLGGTSFSHADLTDADCFQAVLKNACFDSASFVRTRLHLSRNLHLSRLSDTILSDLAVLHLLTSHRGNGQNYTGKSLKGANLAGADLADAIFTEADLSQADLTGASLSRATLIKTQALGTQFRQADLTGACIEAWNIDSTTQLEGVVCEYAYLLRNQQERRPNSGTFQPGEFTKLFQEVLNTVDLIFQNGIDWKAFLHTFRQVQVEHEGAELAIQSIENKGDGVVVVKLNASPDTDKSAIHTLFMQGYHMALQEAEDRYRAKLDAKDEQISNYRQQNANMQEVVKLLAARPINVDVKAIAQSKAMQGNDQSRNVNIGGDFNATDANVTFNLGELSGQVSNQIQQLPDSPTDKTSLKDLLAQLRAAIDNDDGLSDEEKADALAEVSELATAGQQPQQPTAQKTAKRSLNALKGIVSGLSDASKLATACEKLLPMLMSAFGL